MATRLYFHDAASDVAGTLPNPGALKSVDGTTLYNVEASDAQTNRSMTETIGAGQTSAALTTDATTAARTYLFRRFISPPLAAQTIASQTITVSVGGQESNTNSDMFESGSIVLSLWRPSTGAHINFLIGTPAVVLNEPSTSQTHCTGTQSSTSRTCNDGDVIVCDVVSAQSQNMGNAYTNTVFYDGTTEGSTSNIAAFVNFANTITFAAAGNTYTKAGFGRENA